MQKGFVNVPLMVFITMLVVTAGVFYMVGRGSVETNQSTLPQPSATVSSRINDTLKESPPTNNWLSANVDKFDEHWPTYTINYPESWTLKDFPVGDGSAGKVYHLVKGGNKIDIYQGVIGNDHACLYDEGNPAQLYTNKKEIQQKGEIWRRSQLKDMSNGPDNYIICGNKVDGRFVSFTDVGTITITTPGSNADILMEVDQILERISY